MKKVIRLKNLYDASLKCFYHNGCYKPYEKYDERNRLILKYWYKALLNGRIDYLSYCDPAHRQFICYHRSSKYDGQIQMSYGHYTDGKLIPFGDTHIRSFDDMDRENNPEGIWEAVKVA